MAVAATSRWIGGARETSTATMEEESRAGVRLRARIWRWRCLSTSKTGMGSGRAETSRGKIGAEGHGPGASSRLLAFLAMASPDRPDGCCWNLSLSCC
ncbi:hypothetical protein V8C35DRAFT_299019 [Trichoderma chlorosporum]